MEGDHRLAELGLDRGISIHALRMEGDIRYRQPCSVQPYFNPRPPHGGRLCAAGRLPEVSDFNPRPPHGGRRGCRRGRNLPERFQSTPSAWRATITSSDSGRCGQISIHALRMEGDSCAARAALWHPDFNPRPPHGGRLQAGSKVEGEGDFNPRPPHGGRPVRQALDLQRIRISIHALRMEGDPSSWARQTVSMISIHALRMEGDSAPGSRHSVQ